MNKIWKVLGSVTGVAMLLGACGGSEGGGGADGDDAGTPTSDATPGNDAAVLPTSCTVDADCTLPVTTPANCAEATCDRVAAKCTYRSRDTDGDGIRASKCTAPGATIETGADCDDADPGTYPGAWDGPDDPSDPTKVASCNGADNDCDGKVDNAGEAQGKVCSCKPNEVQECSATEQGTPITYPNGSPHSGSDCKRGTRTCQANGQWGACQGAVGPKARACTTTTDADCDGSPDNTQDAVCPCAPTTTQSCYTLAGTAGNGPCKAGSQTCNVTATGSAWGDCIGQVGPAGADSCVEGNDNNCNGLKNEACPCLVGKTQGCSNACGATGTQTCIQAGAGGQWGACAWNPFPTQDCGGAVCGTGKKTCQANGSWTSCNNIGGSRACNGADFGRCGSGTQTCINNGAGWSDCAGSADKNCPAGYVAGGPGCVRNYGQHIKPMWNQNGPWSSNFGATVPAGYSISTSLHYYYEEGDCYSDGGPALTEKCFDRNEGITSSETRTHCQTGAAGGCNGIGAAVGSTVRCDFTQRDNWKSSGCAKSVALDYSASGPKGCF